MGFTGGVGWGDGHQEPSPGEIRETRQRFARRIAPAEDQKVILVCAVVDPGDRIPRDRSCSTLTWGPNSFSRADDHLVTTTNRWWCSNRVASSTASSTLGWREGTSSSGRAMTTMRSNERTSPCARTTGTCERWSPPKGSALASNVAVCPTGHSLRRSVAPWPRTVWSIPSERELETRKDRP